MPTNSATLPPAQGHPMEAALGQILLRGLVESATPSQAPSSGIHGPSGSRWGERRDSFSPHQGVGSWRYEMDDRDGYRRHR